LFTHLWILPSAHVTDRAHNPLNYFRFWFLETGKSFVTTKFGNSEQLNCCFIHYPTPPKTVGSL